MIVIQQSAPYRCSDRQLSDALFKMNKFKSKDLGSGRYSWVDNFIMQIQFWIAVQLLFCVDNKIQLSAIKTVAESFIDSKFDRAFKTFVSRYTSKPDIFVVCRWISNLFRKSLFKGHVIWGNQKLQRLVDKLMFHNHGYVMNCKTLSMKLTVRFLLLFIWLNRYQFIISEHVPVDFDQWTCVVSAETITWRNVFSISAWVLAKI